MRHLLEAMCLMDNQTGALLAAVRRSLRWAATTSSEMTRSLRWRFGCAPCRVNQITLKVLEPAEETTAQQPNGDELVLSW